MVQKNTAHHEISALKAGFFQPLAFKGRRRITSAVRPD